MTACEITDIVCNVLGVPVDDVRQKTRKDRADRVVFARFAAISLCRSETSLSLIAIAKFFKLKTHATVLNSVAACNNMVETNPTFAGLFALATRLVVAPEWDRFQLTEFYPFVYSPETVQDE
ncbi:MAG: helix-turn-helix domain-containing protein [Bacteroidales bacterium]|nr:helix-turn-helix domain-containing protein [Bacteroidales bacterium]